MMRILVVDDEEHLRRMMRLTLEASGYAVSEAGDGDEALKLFGDGSRFDATLLDQRMPGMDGLEVLRRMKLQRADACAIMVTAYGTIELAVDAMKLGATDFIRKPMVPDTLRHAVAAAVAKRSGGLGALATHLEDAPEIPGSSGQVRPREIWVTNGFFFRPLDVEPGTTRPNTEHRFVVRRGTETAATEVVVTIEPKATAQVSKQARRDLNPDGAFWREQAQTALLNHLWSEARLPDAGRLVISRVTGTMLDVASSWNKD
jgi:DNA-binding response OmpR family regulator